MVCGSAPDTLFHNVRKHFNFGFETNMINRTLNLVLSSKVIKLSENKFQQLKTKKKLLRSIFTIKTFENGKFPKVANIFFQMLSMKGLINCEKRECQISSEHTAFHVSNVLVQKAKVLFHWVH